MRGTEAPLSALSATEATPRKNFKTRNQAALCHGKHHFSTKPVVSLVRNEDTPDL